LTWVSVALLLLRQAPLLGLVVLGLVAPKTRAVAPLLRPPCQGPGRGKLLPRAFLPHSTPPHHCLRPRGGKAARVALL
jgi:hypothetical protein